MSNVEEKDSDEEGLLPMGTTGAYGETWALDLEEAVLGDWAATMEALPPSVSKVDTADFYPTLHCHIISWLTSPLGWRE